jgi:hypothetical protein
VFDGKLSILFDVRHDNVPDSKHRRGGCLVYHPNLKSRTSVHHIDRASKNTAMSFVDN